MIDNKVQRIVLKDDDILLIKVPMEFLRNRDAVTRLYKAIKKRLLPRTNKILMLPDTVEVSVIGSKEIQEHISNIDLWQLWDENGKTIDEVQ